MKTKIAICSFLILVLTSCDSSGQTKKLSLEPKPGQAIAVFAEGCFWCSEHVFESVVGVKEVVSGYSGGTTKNPTYKMVGTNTTGYAEAVLVYYDPKKVSFSELVTVFFASHDPTTLNRQGPDAGSSYRSIAFYKNAEEEKIIKEKIKFLTKTNAFPDGIVTEIKPLKEFYEAEGYHQDYVKNNPNDNYVQGVSLPRYKLFKRAYKGKLKPNS